MTLLEVDVPEIDDDVPLLAGSTAPYVTKPHGWPVSTTGYTTTARKGRLTVEFGRWPRIDDSESYEEDEHVYGVPSSAAEARYLAELYEEAEAILAAFESGEYVPPPPDGFVYRDHKPRSEHGWMSDIWLSGMKNMLNMNSFFGRSTKTPLDHRMRNLVNRMHGRPEVEYKRPEATGYIKIKLSDETYG